MFAKERSIEQIVETAKIYKENSNDVNDCLLFSWVWLPVFDPWGNLASGTNKKAIYGIVIDIIDNMYLVLHTNGQELLEKQDLILIGSSEMKELNLPDLG